MHELLKQRLRTVNYVGIGAVVLLLTGTAALGIYPMWQRGSENIRATRDLQRQMSQLDSLDEILRQSKAAFAQSEARLKEVENHIPPMSENNFYDRELTNLITANNIKKRSADNNTKELKEYAGYKVGSIDLRGSGSWDNICRFAADIRKMKGLTRLDAITLDAQPGETGPSTTPVIDFKISFSIFFTAR